MIAETNISMGSSAGSEELDTAGTRFACACSGQEAMRY